MKILIGLHSFNINGILKATLSFVRYLRHEFPNCSICVAAPEDRPARNLFAEAGALTKSYENVLELAAYLQNIDFSPDLVIRESFFSPDIKQIALNAGAKFFIRVHDLIPLETRGTEWYSNPESAREYFRNNRNQKMVFVSRHALEYYRGLIHEFGINPEIAYPATCEEDVHLAPVDKYPDGFRILQLGTIYNRKGCLETLEAFRIMSTTQGTSGALLFFIGERNSNNREVEYAANLRHKIQAYELEKSVFILPSTAHPFAELSKFDVLTLHSSSECCPLVIFESMALGRPVVSANVGGISEQIVEGETGFLFERGDVERQAHLLSQVFLSRDRWKESKSEIAATYFKSFSSHKLNERLIRIYGLR